MCACDEIFCQKSVIFTNLRYAKKKLKTLFSFVRWVFRGYNYFINGNISTILSEQSLTSLPCIIGLENSGFPPSESNDTLAIPYGLRVFTIG